MAETTNIAWTDHTFNPWIGCTHVSPGCEFCYAEQTWDKRYHRVEWGGERSRTSAAYRRQPYIWNRKAPGQNHRPCVFCASLADVFDNQVPDEWRDDLWALIANCQNLDWLLLTKRPQNIRKMLPPDWGDGWSHVWLGTTTENQEEADRRLPLLLEIPATVHFASVEPQLEPVDLRRYVGKGLDWVIVGGESGANARPFDPDWARTLRDQCADTGAAFFMKQMGGRRGNRDKLEGLPPDLRIREWPR
jgi:protein gp37